MYYYQIMKYPQYHILDTKLEKIIILIRVE